MTHLLKLPNTVKKKEATQAILSYGSGKKDASWMIFAHLPTSQTRYKIDIGSQKVQGTGICHSSFPLTPPIINSFMT